MREKKMGMRTVLTRLLGIATVACALVATPGVAEAATTADIPSNVKIAQTESTNPYVADTVTLEAGEDYVVGGEIKINHYVVKGGTEQDPTRIYLTGNASVGHWPGSIKDKRGSGYDELFVLDGGYIEFIGTNGNGRTPVYCNGKSFLSENAGRKDGYGDGADKNRVPNSLNLKVSGIELITVGSGVSKRPIALYGTMVDGETATFDNVKVSKWDCTPNGATYGSSHAYSNIATEYEASPAPVTILSSANGAKSLDVAFSNCEFTDNEDDCAGALSVVGRGCRPKVVLNNCTFKNNQQESIWCKELNVQDKNEHTHAGNIVVNNADITLNGCTITSTQEAANYTQDMVMTSAIAVAKNSTCTLNNTQVSDTYAEGTYYHSDANTRRNTVYARGTVTLAGNTTITTNGEKGARGLALDTPGINYYGKLNIADTFTGKVQLSLKDDQLGAYAGTQWKLGTCGIEESDLRARVTTDDPSVGIGRTDDGYVYASRLPHEHVWSVEKAANSSYQLKVTCSGKMRPSDCSYKNGYAVELGIDGATPDKGKLGVTYSGGEVTPTLMMSNKDGYARDDIVSKGDVYISGSRYYKLTKWGDSAGEALEHVPTDAGIYRIESTVKVKGQEGDLTLAREFQIRPLELSKVSGLTFEFNDGGTDTTVDGEKARAYPWTGKTIKPSFSVKIYNYGSQSWSYFVKDNDYVIDGDSTYSTVSAIDPPSSNSYFPYYQIYIKGTGNYTGSAYANWTITGTQFENVTAEGFEGVYDGQPHGVNISVSNAPADMTIEYSFDEGDSWTTEAKSYTDVQRNRKGEICSVTVDYRITAKDYVTKSGSVEIKITPARQPVPWRYIASEGTGVKVKDQSAHLLEDGSLSNLNKTYEWRKYGDTYWESIGAGKTSVDGLPAGKYEVRFKADNNHYASGANVFEIAEGPCASADGTWYKTEGSNGAHWQVCRCGKKLNEDTHVFSWEEVKAPTTEKPGLKRYQCSTCGYVLREEEIPPACIGGYVGVYDGNEHAVSVDLKDDATAQFSIDGGVTWKTDAPTIKNVGKTTVDYKVTTSGASDIKGQVTLEVTPLAITVAPAAASKTYGDPDPDFTYEVTAGSLMEGDTLSDITYKRDEGESVLTGYKTYKVTASQKEGANANYDITFEAGEFTITRRTIDVKWTVGQYVYNGQEQGPTAEITNLVNNDDVSLKVVDAAKVNAGMYTAKVTGLVGEDKVLANYRKPSGIECKYAIAKAKRDSAPNVKATAETVSGKHDGTIEGVDTSMQLGKPSKQMMFIKTSDLADGDKLENLAPGSYRLCYGATTNYEASEIVTVTIAAGRKLKVTLPAEQTGYTLTADATELDWHGSATLKITVADGYYATKGLAVKANGETIKSSEQGVYQLSKVEKDAVITVEGIARHEPDGAGWKSDGSSHWHVCTCGERIDVAEHSFEWIIDEKPTVEKPGSKHQHCSVCGYDSPEKVVIPSASVAGYSGEYDGKVHTADVSALPEGTAVQYSIDGGVNWSATVPEIKNVGTLPFKYSATVDGAAIEGEAELVVTPRKVTVTASDASKTYGDDDPALGSEVTEGKLVEGESLEGITVSREAGEAVRKGGYAVTASQSEGANPNYEITFVDGKFIITKRELTVEWDATAEFTYDGEEHCPMADLGNVMGDDDVSAYVDGAAVKAGAYTAEITELMGADKGNYKLPATGLTCKFSIKKAPKGAPVVQGVAETVSAKADGKITGVDVAMEWRAKDSDEYQAVEEGATELCGLAAGTYEVRYRVDDDHEASAATKVTVAEGRKLVVTLPAKQVGYKLTADATELDWHGSATLTISIEDGYFADSLTYVVKVNGGAVTPNERGEFTVQDVEGDVRVTVEGVHKHEAVNDKWLSDDNAHWHECTCGEKIDEAAHTFEWVVDKAPTATEAGSKHQQCTVCGHALPAVEIPAAAIAGYSDEYDGAYHTVDATRLPEGATAQYSTDGKNWSSEAPKIRDVGTLTVSYKVTIDGTTAEGEVTLEVKPCPITVAADDASKTYGEADPVFTWTITSGELVEGESLQGIEIEREDDDNVREGGYALQLTQPEGANPNYSITFVDGAFTINQRLLTVTWGTTEFTYDGKEHCPVATLGNVIGNDDLGATVEGSQTEVGTSYKATLTALTGKAAGNYALPADGLTCEFSIKKAAQDAPKVQAEAETVSGRHDGKIAGVNATMEWRAKGAAEYQAVGEGVTELKDLAAGVYEVRYQAKANYDASSATEITVAAGRKLVVALPTNQQGYTLTATATELDWHGSATLTVSIDSAYFAGKGYAVKVDGKAIELSDKGTYELKDVEGDVNVTVEGVLKHESDGTGWAHDAKNHWHVCRCGDIIDKAEHTFEWVVDWPATVEAKGEKHQECTVCHEKGKTEEIAILAPEITDGKGQTMVVEAAKDLTFRSSAPLEFFRKVLVDGKEVARENYELTEGSTIVTLKASFLNTLGVGEHTLSVVSTTGTAETTFTVAEAAKPAPGQTTTTTTTTTTTSKPKKKAGKETLPESGDSTYVMAGAVLAVGVAALLLAWAMKRRA